MASTIEVGVKYHRICRFIDEGEYEFALKELNDSLDKVHSVNERSRLRLFMSYVYYKYEFYPLAYDAIRAALKERDKLSKQIVLEGLYIKALCLIQQKKYDRCRDIINECYALDPNNKEADTLTEILKSCR